MALLLLGVFPALAMAEGLEITSPLGGSFSSMPTFSGTTNGTLNPVTLSVYPGTATSGTPETTATSIPSGTSWSTTPSQLVPGTYTAVASENNETLEVQFSNNAVTFTIVPATTKPQVTSNPQSVKVNPGGSATFKASASGTPAPGVEWEESRDGGVTWIHTGVTSGTLTVSPVTSLQNEYIYRALFKNSAGEATSAPATLSVPPTISVPPKSQEVNPGENATFTISVSGHPNPTVQWFENGGKGWEKIPGATSETLVITNATAHDGTQYGAVVKNSGGSINSAVATLTIAKSPPAVTLNPASTVVAVGEPAIFTATASGVPTPTAQWEESRYGGPWVPVSGATSTTLKTHPQNVEGQFLYRARFKNPSGEAVTTPAAATVTSPRAPSIIVNPLSTTVLAGGTATFTAAASGPPPPSAQWQESSNAGASWTSIRGATEDVLRIAGASTSQSGHQFRAVFTNELGTATSAVATLTVSTPASPPPPALASLVPGFTFFPPTPHVGEPVTLASTSTDAASPIIGFAWDFAGNGSFAPAGPLVTTSFATPGPHVVHLRAGAANGVTREVGQTINVLARQLNLIQPFPVIRMVGSLMSSGVKISVLTVQAPAGSLVSARCVGKRCPLKLERAYAKARAGSTRVLPVTLWRFERLLRAGVVLQIKVSKAGQVGKYTSFTVRRGRVPVRLDECLDPTRLTPMACPGS